MSSIGESGPINSFNRFTQNPWEVYSPQRDLFNDVGNIEREIEKTFQEQFQEIESRVPKELVREYGTEQEGKVREIGPIIYGYSVTLSSNGKPMVREFGNFRPSTRNRPNIWGIMSGGEFTPSREPLDNMVRFDKEIKIIAELPGISKEDIRIDTYEGSVEIIAGNSNRKYKRIVEIPAGWDVETARSTFKNGLLEISFDKTKKPERKGRQIKIE